MPTLIEEFATALGRRPAPSDAVQSEIRRHVADALGAWIAGSATAEGRALGEFLPSLGNTAADRVAIACGTARLSEIDDIHLGSLVTPGAVVVPTALILAGASRADGARLLAAIADGYEAMVRLGAALDGATILYRGIWPTYIAAPFGAAAVAARLFGLDPAPTANALALALSLSAPAVGQPSGTQTSRWLACGLAARNGVTAALAARAGFIADRGLLEGHVFPSVYGLTPDRAKLRSVKQAVAEVSFKPWCAARQTMAATQALRELLADGMAPADITEIVAAVPPVQLKMVNHGVRAGDRLSHLTSLPYNLALAALQPDALYEITPPPVSVDEQALMTKVTVEADDGLAALYPGVWAGRVIVRTRTGETSKTVRNVPGDPERPLDDRQLLDKLRRVTGQDAAVAEARKLLRGGDLLATATAALKAGGVALA